MRSARRKAGNRGQEPAKERIVDVNIVDGDVARVCDCDGIVNLVACVLGGGRGHRFDEGTGLDNGQLRITRQGRCGAVRNFGQGDVVGILRVHRSGVGLVTRGGSQVSQGDGIAAGIGPHFAGAQAGNRRHKAGGQVGVIDHNAVQGLVATVGHNEGVGDGFTSIRTAVAIDVIIGRCCFGQGDGRIRRLGDVIVFVEIFDHSALRRQRSDIGAVRDSFIVNVGLGHHIGAGAGQLPRRCQRHGCGHIASEIGKHRVGGRYIRQGLVAGVFDQQRISDGFPDCRTRSRIGRLGNGDGRREIGARHNGIDQRLNGQRCRAKWRENRCRKGFVAYESRVQFGLSDRVFFFADRDMGRRHRNRVEIPKRCEVPAQDIANTGADDVIGDIDIAGKGRAAGVRHRIAIAQDVAGRGKLGCPGIAVHRDQLFDDVQRWGDAGGHDLAVGGRAGDPIGRPSVVQDRTQGRVISGQRVVRRASQHRARSTAAGEAAACDIADHVVVDGNRTGH